MSTHWRVTLIVVFLVVMAVSTAIAIVYKLPYEFGGIGDAHTVAADAITHGTAISPPITTLVGFLIFALLSFRRGWLGAVGSVGVLLVNLLFLIAGSAEPIVWRILYAASFGALEVIILGLSLLGFTLSLGLVILAGTDLRNRTLARRHV